MTLQLLFTKDGLQSQLAASNKMSEEQSWFVDEESPARLISEKLDQLLAAKNFDQISVVSALNHFTLMPEGFDNHGLGYDLIGFNADADREKEELMLSVNKKFGVQFYYTFPKDFYLKIKSAGVPANFNFSGEKFLSIIQPKNGAEIHINLYYHQCEFFALKNKKVLLYNNLDVNSEVDFLYFIMFTLSKIGFGISETQFFVYGETTENETFISELSKFVKNLKIVFDNIPGRRFLMGNG